MDWKTIKTGMYLYLYGAEERMTEALKRAVRRKLESIEKLLLDQLLMTTQAPPHDGPTIDLSPTEYRVLRQRDAPVRDRFGNDLDARPSPTGRLFSDYLV